MTADPNQFYCVGGFVYPNQQEVALNMAFHMACIITMQYVGLIFLRNRDSGLRVFDTESVQCGPHHSQAFDLVWIRVQDALIHALKIFRFCSHIRHSGCYYQNLKPICRLNI